MHNLPLLTCYLALINAILTGVYCSAEELNRNPNIARGLKQTASDIERAEKQFFQQAQRAYINYHRILKLQLQRASSEKMKAALETEIANAQQSINALKDDRVQWISKEAAVDGQQPDNQQQVRIDKEKIANATKLWAQAGVPLRNLTPITTGNNLIRGDDVKPKWRRRADIVIDDFESGVAIDNLFSLKLEGATHDGSAPTAMGGKRETCVLVNGMVRHGLTDGPDVIQMVGQGQYKITPATRIYFRYTLPSKAQDVTRLSNAFYVRLRHDPGATQKTRVSILGRNTDGSLFTMGHTLDGRREYVIRFKDTSQGEVKTLAHVTLNIHFGGKPAFLEIEEWGVTRR